MTAPVWSITVALICTVSPAADMLTPEGDSEMEAATGVSSSVLEGSPHEVTSAARVRMPRPRIQDVGMSDMKSQASDAQSRPLR